jgi:hypothetical protein
MGNFCIFILSHGRPDNVLTYKELKKAGYTGKVYIVIDDEDSKAGRYDDLFGDIVLRFSKSEIAKRFDQGDNTEDRRSIFYARNACFDLAKSVGCVYFMQMDDDYFAFQYRYNNVMDWDCIRVRKTFDQAVSVLLDYYKSTPFASIAISQGGDHIGGGEGRPIRAKRKAMNSFICSTDRRFSFVGRINEDVNTYTSKQRCGLLFLTIMQMQLVQKVTQSNSGGMTEMYLDSGTYMKTFYSVMYCPSSVVVSELGDSGAGGPSAFVQNRIDATPHYRIHHAINWNRTAPCILRETHRKATHTGANTDAP